MSRSSLLAVCLLMVLSACTDGGGGGAAATSATAVTATTAAGAKVTVEGEPVAGAAVTVVAERLASDAGRWGVRIRALDDEAYTERGNGASPVDGTLRIELYVPVTLTHDGPCKTTAPCDLYAVRPGAYGLDIIRGAGREMVTTGELTVVHGRAGVPYRVTLTSECGPPRVHFDQAVWVLSRPQPAQHWDSSGLTAGTITVIDAERATFTRDAAGPFDLKPADAATIATTGC